MIRVTILSRSRKFFATREIEKSLKRRGAKPIHVKTPQVRLIVEEKEMDVLYDNQSIKGVDSVIPRIGRSLTDFGYTIIRQYEMLGVPTTLSSHGLINARNKFRALQTLSIYGIPIPTTWLLASRVTPMIIKEMDFPVVLKLLSGTQGIGVIRVRDKRDAIPIIDALDELGQIICIQKFLENPGEDIRAFIVDKEVVAAMKRIAPTDDWRANIHAGGRGVSYKLTPEEERMAIKAAEALDVGVAGVDMIQTDDGAYIIEVNVSPGFEGLLSATGVNAADAIAEYAVKIAKR